MGVKRFEVYLLTIHHFKNTDTASTIKASVRAAQIGRLEASSCNTGAAVTCNVTKIEYKDRYIRVLFLETTWKFCGKTRYVLRDARHSCG